MKIEFFLLFICILLNVVELNLKRSITRFSLSIFFIINLTLLFLELNSFKIKTISFLAINMALFIGVFLLLAFGQKGFIEGGDQDVEENIDE